MAVIDTGPLDRLASRMRQERSADASLADVVRLAEISAEAMQAFYAALDSAVLREMRDIADYITKMRREIGSLQVNEIRHAQIPAAGQELDAIVKATEAATNTIIGCAEAVMAADLADPGRYKRLVDERMTVVFEACSFHDITGQRIAKVVETLKHIEARITRFAEAIRAHDIPGPQTENEVACAARKGDLLLYGPASGETGALQSEVDALLAPEKPGGNTQADIDRLLG